MSRLILASERVRRARQFIQEARDLPVPPDTELANIIFPTWRRLKLYWQDARDLIKYIPKTPSATAEIKEQVTLLLQEADRANQEICISTCRFAPTTLRKMTFNTCNSFRASETIETFCAFGTLEPLAP